MNALVPHIRPDDPSEMGWPHTLPLELAMKVAPVSVICEAYEISREDYENLRSNPRFVAEVREWREALKEEGMSFKIKARMQAEELLKTSWEMIHDRTTPAAVRADLIKHTTRVAGLEPQKGEGDGSGMPTFAIQINLGDK